LWATKPETANRVRGRIEVVLDWARVRGYRAGENPARWRGHLDHLLPARSKVRKVKHYRALPYTDMGAFMAHLRSRPGVGASALAFLILTATHTFWTNPAGIIRAAAHQYREDLWAGQRYRPEVWIEKEALLGVVEGVCTELRVPYFAHRGNNSQTLQY